MSKPWKDQPFIRWAERNAFSYYYTSEFGLPECCLKLQMSVVTLYVHEGKVVRLLVASEGEMLDQTMYELSQIFALCTQHHAYPEQALCDSKTTLPRHNHNRLTG